MYLASKSGRFLPADTAARFETLQWLMWQMGGVGPGVRPARLLPQVCGQGLRRQTPRDRYAAESKRLLGVLEQRLTGRRWVMGDEYTIADIAIFLGAQPGGLYGAGELVEFELPAGAACAGGVRGAPAVQRGLAIPARD